MVSFNFVDGPQRLPQVLEEGPGWYATPCMSEMSKYDPPASQRSAMLTQSSVLDPRGTCAAHPDEQRRDLVDKFPEGGLGDPVLRGERDVREVDTVRSRHGVI